MKATKVTVTPIEDGARELSNRALIGEITGKASLLARKEIELAKAELRADLGAQLATATVLGVAVLAAVLALAALLVAGILALGLLIAGWLAALLVAVILLVVALAAGYLGWRRLVVTPLARTRQSLKEDVRWVKEHLT